MQWCRQTRGCTCMEGSVCIRSAYVTLVAQVSSCSTRPVDDQRHVTYAQQHKFNCTLSRGEFVQHQEISLSSEIHPPLPAARVTPSYGSFTLVCMSCIVCLYHCLLSAEDVVEHRCCHGVQQSTQLLQASHCQVSAMTHSGTMFAYLLAFRQRVRQNHPKYSYRR